MAKINPARRAEIGRERRARTRAQILEATEILLAERPPEALTIDAIVDAAGVAKGTFYYHFQSIDELTAAVGAKLGESFDDLLAPARLGLPDPIARLSFGLTKFLEKAIAEPLWARLVIQSAQAPTGVREGIRANLKADLAEAMAQKRLSVQDPELAADIVIGIWLQVARGTLERGAAPNLAGQIVDAVLRALGATQPEARRGPGSRTHRPSRSSRRNARG
jgi:AcrR family transcriptional regulator